MTAFPQVHELTVSNELTLYTVLVEDREGYIYSKTVTKNPSETDLAEWQGMKGWMLEEEGWQAI